MNSRLLMSAPLIEDAYRISPSENSGGADRASRL